jgi:hypothetical protein
VGWNGFWIGRGLLPPSILNYFTGLPVPTTGFTRSQLALLRGDVGASLAWNALGVPIVVLLVLTAIVLARRVVEGGRLVIPQRLATAWIAVLAAAWVVKLVQGPQWW